MQIDDLPIELQAKIIEFTVKEDQKELRKIAQTSSQWKTLTEEICFWQPIFGNLLFQKFLILIFLRENNTRIVNYSRIRRRKSHPKLARQVPSIFKPKTLRLFSDAQKRSENS